MTHDDNQLRRMLAGFNFPGEPVEAGLAADDLGRARHWQRRRAATWTTVTAAVAAVGASVAFALPNLGTDGGDEVLAAGEPSVMEDAGCGDTAADDGHLAFPSTRQCLLDIAAKHFDPERVHLPEVSENAGTGGGGGGWLVSSKLDWRVPGESGLGMVQVAVSTPGYADGESAEFDVAWRIGCEDIADCTYQTVPGTGEQVLVAEADPERNLLLGVMYERPDGSFTGVGVYDLFGNNSLEPVSNVDITLEQAIAFVTDPALKVQHWEIGSAEDMFAQEQAMVDEAERLQEEADYSSTEVVPAPAAREMTDAELRQALDACIEGIDEWNDFEPVFGLSIDSGSGAVAMMIAERGATKMLCDTAGGSAMLFGTSEVKSTPYLRGEVFMEIMNFGRYTPEVDRVTVQVSGGPLQEALMKDGYWFLLDDFEWGTGDDDFRPVALRGYDADGNLIYDSSTVDPNACFSDPDGTEIVQYGAVEDPDVEDCIRMLEWGF